MQGIYDYCGTWPQYKSLFRGGQDHATFPFLFEFEKNRVKIISWVEAVSVTGRDFLFITAPLTVHIFPLDGY